MGDNKYGTPLHQGVHTALYNSLGTGINGGGRLIQDHNRRVCHSRPGNGDQLPLPLGQAAAVSGKHRIIAMGQHPDKAVRIGQLRRRDTFLIGSIQLAVPDIVHYRTGKQVHILQYHTEGTAQGRFRDPADINAVVSDGTLLDIIEAVDQVGDGRLSGSGSPHKGHLLARLRVKRNVMQDCLFRHITKVHIVELHMSLHLYHIKRTVLFRHLPGPAVGTLFAFY